MKKILIVRLSSFGDIVQAMAVPKALKTHWPDAEVDWLVRKDYESLLQAHDFVDKVIAFDRSQKFSGFLRLAWQLSNQNYSHVYDAHNNLRSRLLGLCFLIRRLTFRTRWLRRSKERWKRFLLFRYQINHFPKPYVAQDSFLNPLRKWGIQQFPRGPHFFIPQDVKDGVAKLIPEDFICLVPSAAWPLKRWPISHWIDLMKKVNHPNWVLLGGKEDSFIDSICASVAGKKIVNLRGKTSLLESCAVIEKARVVVSNDTGLLHVADLLEKPLVALIGPSAFGYPKSVNASVCEVTLYCKPCSKDGSDACKHPMQQKCMKDIKPERVAIEVKRKL